MYSALIKRIFSVCLAFSSLLILYSLFLVNSAFASSITNCSPNGQSYNQSQSITFSGSTYYDAGVAGTASFSITITDPNNSTQTTNTGVTYDFPANPPTTISCTDIYTSSFTTVGTYQWYITGTIPGVGSISSSPTSFTIDTPPPNLPTNISFSGEDPTGGASRTNPVTFSLTIIDNEPTSGTRTVDFYIDGAWQNSLSYTKADLSGNSITGSTTINSPTGAHIWNVIVSMGGSSKQSPPYQYVAQTSALLPPSNMQVSCWPPAGLTGPNGLEWCDASGPQILRADGSTRNGEPPTFNVSGIPGSPLSSICGPPNGSISDCTVSPGSSGWTNNTTYYWSAYTSGSSGGNWTSSTGTATNTSGAFGIDTENPNVAAGTPFLTLEGGTWKVKWTHNGSDAGSGIGKITVSLQDTTTGCLQLYSYQEMPSLPTQASFSNCGNTAPVPGHTYQLGAESCDYALNCYGIETPGFYDGGLTPTYTISGNVFVDENGNGTKDWLTDTDYKCVGNCILFNGTTGTTTDWSGNYSFTDLPAGTYSIELIVPVGYMLTTPPALRTIILSADSPNNNFGIRYNGGPTSTPTPVPATFPTLQSLKVNLSDAGQVAQVNGLTFSGVYGISGNQTGSDSGVKWLNPINITLNARRGNLNLPIHRYYVAFYDKTTGARLTNKGSFIADIKKKLNPNATPPGNPKNGVLLAYGIESKITGAGSTTAYHYYIWNKTGWEKITTSSYAVKDASNNTLFTATKIANGFLSPNYYVTWKIDFDKNFGSKPMYTAVYVADQIGQSDFNSSIVPNP